MIRLAPPDPAWPNMAKAEADRWFSADLPGLVTIHHIGSTSVPGLPAKPIVDLLPVFSGYDRIEEVQEKVEALGYVWMGENGLPGRRYVQLDDPETGTRVVAKYHINSGNFSPGYVTPDNRWTNYWRSGINARLGWSPKNDEEKFDNAFLIENFTLDRIGKSAGQISKGD